MKMADKYEKIIRREIVDKGNVSIDTAIKMIITMRSLEDDPPNERIVYIPQYVNPYSLERFYPYVEGE